MTIMGMPGYTPRDRGDDYVSALSTAGYTTHGGFVMPGQEWRLASTGKRKTAANQPVRKVSAKLAPVRADDTDRPITGGRVLTPGRYTWDGVEYLVKISKSSGKPYAVRADDGVYVAGMARMLRLSDRIGDLESVRRDIPLGLYNVDDDIVLVRLGRSGHKFGSVLTDGRWVFTRGIMPRIDVDNPATYAQVIAYGLETGECMICSRTLTKRESIDRGIGPICAAKYGWVDVDTDPSAPAVELDTTPDTFPATELADVDPTTIPGLTDVTPVPVVPTSTDENTAITGPVVAANGRLDHSGCSHPNTTSARTKCRNAFRHAN